MESAGETGRPAAAGLILAGGRARRMGGLDKPFAGIAGRPLIAHVIGRLAPQAGPLAVVAPAAAGARLAALGLEVLADATEGGRIEEGAGPLAGLLAGLDWAAGLAGARRLVVVPADVPLLPVDFVTRASAALDAGDDEVACAASGGRLHPTVAVWPLAVRERVRRAVADEGLRRAAGLLDAFRVARIDYDCAPADPFFNVNAPGDLAEAERLLAELNFS